jgi:cytochrome P450
MNVLSSLKFPSKWDSITQPSSSLIAGTAVSLFALLMTNKQFYLRVLYPGVVPDRKYRKTHSLPPGEITGCPYFGSIAMFPDINKWVHEIGLKIAAPVTIFKAYFFGGPGVIIVGTSKTRRILNKEFTANEGVSQPVNAFGNSLEIFGTNSLSFETKDKSKYRFLKSLLQQAMTHEAVAEGMQALQEASESVLINKILKTAKEEGSVEVEKYMKYMTLDVAWRQILGLELSSEEEIEEFHKNVAIWLNALQSAKVFIYAMLPMVFVKMTKEYKARMYLSSKIMDKINAVEARGSSDGSTVGAMYYTKDEEDPSKTLSKAQIIDNALILIAAGSETSASTLTNAIFLLGLHPEIFTKLRDEQEALIKAKGEALTKDLIDHECPYLEAVVKEVMRVCPIQGGPTRVTNGTITTDEYQIPKGWWVMPSVYLTHEHDPVTKIDDGSHMDLEKGFKPERWLSKETQPKEYMPWGMSYRFCAGHILAMAEMKTFLAIFSRKVKSFDLVNKPENVKDIKFKFGAIGTPKGGVPITLES